MAYFDRENAGQCGSCFNGTAAMVGGHRGAARRASRRTRTLPVWSAGRWCCAAAARARTLDGATNVAASLLRQFPQLVARHLAKRLPDMPAGAFSAVRPYEVEAVVATA